MTRRSFLTYLGVGSAALAAGSAGVAAGPAGAQAGFAGAASTPYRVGPGEGFALSFEPIEPTDADELVLPDGFKFDIIRRWGDPVTADANFGYNNDYVPYFPIDALQGGASSEDGLLWVNHEYTNPMYVSDYDVSSGTFEPGSTDREAHSRLLADGMLYVADFANGRWVTLDYENNPVFGENDFSGQADVLVRAPQAAKLEDPETETPLGTPMDRWEDIEVHPGDGTIYAALTNNELHGNFHGQIIRMYEKDGDAEATEFDFEVFAAGGPNTEFSSPYNLAFDGANNLWMVTDISSGSQNQGIYSSFKNNGVFVMRGANDAVQGEPVQFASGPVESEMTGPAFTPDGKTTFLPVQHPGEETENKNEPTSTWPHDGDNVPKPSVVAITRSA